MGIDEALNSWLAKNKGMALPSSIFDANGFIISLSCCPDPTTPNALLELASDEQLIDQIRGRF